MNPQEIVSQLEANAKVFAALLDCSDVDFINWQPAADKWNLREIVAHLYDEEREDFRARVLHFLYRPNETLKPIDPEGWVKDREYNEMDYDLVLQDFLKERDESVSLLRGIGDDLWKPEYEHEHWGRIGPRFFLVNWLAHDYQHIKQINRQKYLYLQEQSNLSIEYAG